MTKTANIIFSILILIMCIALILLSFYLIKKMHQQYKKSKYVGLDNLLRYEKLMDFINYQTNNQNFTLILISIDNFLQIKSYIEDETITVYLNKLGKVIQNHLKKGWKFAQTKEREAFLLYAENLESKDDFFGTILKLKQALEKVVSLENGLDVYRTFTISYINFPNEANNLEQLVARLYSSLLKGKKLGGNELIHFHEGIYEDKEAFDKYFTIKENVLQNKYSFEFYPLVNTSNEILGLETNIVLNEENKKIKFEEFIVSYEASLDAYWFSNWAFEKTLEEAFEVLRVNEEKTLNLFIPASLQQLSNENIIDRLVKIADKYKVLKQRIVIDIVNTNTKYDQLKVRNHISNLKKQGFNFSTTLNDNYKDGSEKDLYLDFIFVNKELVDNKKHLLNAQLSLIKKIVKNIDLNGINDLDISNSYLYKLNDSVHIAKSDLIKQVNNYSDK